MLRQGAPFPSFRPPFQPITPPFSRRIGPFPRICASLQCFLPSTRSILRRTRRTAARIRLTTSLFLRLAGWFVFFPAPLPGLARKPHGTTSPLLGLTPRTPGSRHHPAYDAMIPWIHATNPGIHATVPRNDATIPQYQAFIPWGTPLHPGSEMKIKTQVATNPGSHRPNPGSGPKNPRIRRSTPGSRPQSQSPAADPRVGALAGLKSTLGFADAVRYLPPSWLPKNCLLKSRVSPLKSGAFWLK